MCSFWCARGLLRGFHGWLCITWHTVLVDSLLLPPQVCCSPHSTHTNGTQCLQDSQNSMISSLQVRQEQWRASRNQKVNLIKGDWRNWAYLILRRGHNGKIHEYFLSIWRWQPDKNQDLFSIVSEYIIYIGEYFCVCICSSMCLFCMSNLMMVLITQSNGCLPLLGISKWKLTVIL